MAGIVSGCVQMYLFCLFMRVLLSWFPSIDWNTQPWTFLRLVRALHLLLAALPLSFTLLLGCCPWLRIS